VEGLFFAALEEGWEMKPEKQLSLALAAILGVILMGTAGYMAIEGWGILDATYMTIISLTTVGFGEVQPLSQQGKFFTIALILGGVATVTGTITIGTQILLAGQLQKVMGRKKLEKEIKKLHNHYIICGHGRMGKIICHEFARKPVPFVVIEENIEVFKRISSGILAIQGNASEESVLLEAGIKKARGLVSVASSDADNVYITLTAIGLRPDLYIVARAGEAGSEQKLLRAGASKVVSPYTIGGTGIANAILRPAVVDFIELVTKREHLELQMEEVLISKGSSLAGKTILEAGVRQRLGIIVVAVKKEEGLMEFNPSSSTGIESGDRLIVLGGGESLARLEALAGS
jgi:voltage-gated potassium channel